MEEKKLTGYPSVDKPWLKYYSDKAINAELPNDTLYESLKKSNHDNMDCIALDYYGNKISYRNFLRNIDIVANSLALNGIRHGDIVTVCSLNSPETIYLLYALNKVGAIANMVSGLTDTKELRRTINDTGSKLLFTLDIFQEKIVDILEMTALEKVVVLNLTASMGTVTRIAACMLKGMSPKRLPDDSRFISWQNFIQKNAPEVASNGLADDIAVITYTGGTTGGSKGVMLSSKALIASSQQYIWCETALDRGQTWIQFFPLFIAYGVGPSLHLPLMAGDTLIVRIPMSDKISDLIAKYKPNHILSGPALWTELAEENRNLDLTSMIEPTSGGDKLPVPVEEKINHYLLSHGSQYPLMNGYGLSEVAAAVSVNTKKAHCIGSVGIPFCKNIISAFDLDSGEELSYGQEGEICIHTPSMMTGYINAPDDTAQMIHTHEDGRKWLHSGDLGYVSEDGFVFITGRLKRYFLYISNGEQKKVFSADIEKVLLTHPLVENCAVIPVPHKTKNQVAKAYIKLKGSAYDAEKAKLELRRFCTDNMPERFRPEKYEFVSNYPLTKIGKIDYRALEREVAEQLP